MLTLIDSGWAFGLVLLLMGVEGVLLSWYARRTARGLVLRDLWPNLLAGMGLLAAALTVARHGDPRLAGSLLILALLGHLLDLRWRWRR